MIVGALKPSISNHSMPHTLRSLLNELARLIPKVGVKRASSFDRELRVRGMLSSTKYTVH